MRVEDSTLKAELAALGVELRPNASLAELTCLGIGGTTDLLRITKHESIPALIALLEQSHIPHKFLGGGSNLLVGDGELPWIILQLAKPDPEIVLEGKLAHVDAAADLGRTVTYCAKHDLGGMEGLIGVPGTVAGSGPIGIQITNTADGSSVDSYSATLALPAGGIPNNDAVISDSFSVATTGRFLATGGKPFRREHLALSSGASRNVSR